MYPLKSNFDNCYEANLIYEFWYLFLGNCRIGRNWLTFTLFVRYISSQEVSLAFIDGPWRIMFLLFFKLLLRCCLSTTRCYLGTGILLSQTLVLSRLWRHNIEEALPCPGNTVCRRRRMTTHGAYKSLLRSANIMRVTINKASARLRFES